MFHSLGGQSNGQSTYHLEVDTYVKDWLDRSIWETQIPALHKPECPALWKAESALLGGGWGGVEAIYKGCPPHIDM